MSSPAGVPLKPMIEFYGHHSHILEAPATEDRFDPNFDGAGKIPPNPGGDHHSLPVCCQVETAETLLRCGQLRRLRLSGGWCSDYPVHLKPVLESPGLA